MTTADTHPVQSTVRIERLPTAVTLRAYEVYCAIHSEQAAMVTGHCRGGFHVEELLAFLYARSFPPAEWRQRVDEAFKGMKTR